MASDRQAHWDKVYAAKSPREVSWRQERPDVSLQLIARLGIAKDAPILDVGAGASTLIGALLDEGYSDVSALDISGGAIARLREALGANAGKVTTYVADITTWRPPQRFALWHDRAALHFLTASEDQAAYGETLRSALAPGGYTIISGFAPGGPETCSGLPIVQHDAQSLSRILGAAFELLDQIDENHRTPRGATQAFRYYAYKQRSTSPM